MVVKITKNTAKGPEPHIATNKNIYMYIYMYRKDCVGTPLQYTTVQKNTEDYNTGTGYHTPRPSEASDSDQEDETLERETVQLERTSRG